MLYRFNGILLLLGGLLLLPGLVFVLTIETWSPEAVLRVGHLARPWFAAMLCLSGAPLLSWSVRGLGRAFRQFGPAVGLVLAALFLVVTANLSFWALVTFKFAPAQERYQEGRLVWIGRHALIFGHGYWKLGDGYWQHQTVVRLPDGTVYTGPTLDLLTRLRGRGARSVWGSWCYSGDFPYIRKDLITGEETLWPSYTSYNRSPGKTIPIWLGVQFFRLGWQNERYDAAPELLAYVPADTLLLARPSLGSIERAADVLRKRVRGLPRPDSISWQPVPPDTVLSVSWREYRTLAQEQRQALREMEREQVSLKARVGVAHYWVRGRAFPVPIKVPARIYRPSEPVLSPESVLQVPPASAAAAYGRSTR